jgi:hypothetical protein
MQKFVFRGRDQEQEKLGEKGQKIKARRHK